MDALYVSPLSESREAVDENALTASGLLGSYRRDIGWDEHSGKGAHTDLGYHVLFQAR